MSDPAKPPRSLLSPELAAMNKLDRLLGKVLEPLKEQERRRVLRWIAGRAEQHQLDFDAAEAKKTAPVLNGATGPL